MKTFNISLFKQISLFSLEKTNNDSDYIFFELEGTKYYFLNFPNYVSLEKSSDTISFKNKGGLRYEKKFINFSALLVDIINNNNKKHKLSLTLKGAGYNASISDCKKYLKLSIGFSNPYMLEIPTDKVKAECDKNIITLEGWDKVFVGDFLAKIRKLKMPDVYKGKGFWLRNEVRSFKDIKKL